VHLHSLPESAGAKILAAYDAGARRFDSAIGGLGGCPFAQDELVGNIATESVLQAMSGRGIPVPICRPLEALQKMNAEIAAQYAK
jgi:hydroxymethylglutaryl-CoA lyase